MAMAPKAAAVDFAASHLQRREQAGGAVTLIVMGHLGGDARSERQQRLSAVKRLNLALFVHTQHQRSLGRVQVKPDDVSQFAVELRVGTELESLDSMGLQTVLAPDPVHGHEADAHLFGQPPRAPMGRGRGQATSRRNHRKFLGPGDPARSSAAPAAPKTAHSLLLITPPPQTYSAPGQPQLLRDRTQRTAFPAQQHDSRPHPQRLRYGLAPQPGLQHLPVLRLYLKLHRLHISIRRWSPIFNSVT